MPQANETMTATVVMLGGKPAILMPGSSLEDKLVCLVWLEGEYAEGQAVEYEIRHDSGFEGDAVRVNDQTMPMSNAYLGKAATLSGVADDLNIDEDGLGLTHL